MRILLWHGYLLGGTGSNVYTRAIAREWSRGGHDVVVVSQEGNPELYDLGGARTVRPDIGAALPELGPADLLFANHVLLGGPVAAASGLPYAVKAHGSELEYAMRGNEELARWGREGLAGAKAVFVGSAH